MLLSHEDLKIKLGLDKDIQLLRFDYHTQPGKELLEIVLVGDTVDIKVPVNKRTWHCNHCNSNWEAMGLEINCPKCTSEDIEESL